MATNMTSAVVSAGDDILASQYNNLRSDVVVNAGDYEDSAGSSNAYTLSIDASISAYAAGQVFKFRASFTNTDSATLNVNTIGAVTLKKAGDRNLLPGDIKSGQIVVVIHDGTNFQVLSTTQLPVRLLPAYQSIYTGVGPSADYDEAQVAISPDGKYVFFGFINGTTDLVSIYRFEVDQKTGLLHRGATSVSTTLASGTYGWSGSKGFGLAVSNTYVWACGGDGSNTVIVRLTHALGSPTDMTISGTASTAAFCGAAANSDDGTVYLKNQSTANNVLQYSISGTTATRGSDITLSSATTAGTFHFDGTYFYMMDEGAGSLRRYNASGTVQASHSGYQSLGTDDYDIAFSGAGTEITTKHRCGVGKFQDDVILFHIININETTNDSMWLDTLVVSDF